MRTNFRPFVRAFTLIELLVVITIIASGGIVSFGIIVRVHQAGQLHLFFVIEASDTPSSLLGIRQRREQHGRQDGYDVDDNQQFDQGESVLATHPATNLVPEDAACSVSAFNHNREF